MATLKSRKDKNNAMVHCRAISTINCQNKLARLEPRTFLIPTSLARLKDDAIERLLKLIAPVERSSIAKTNKIEIVPILLVPCLGTLWIS
ncbi:hypothetical protein D3C86_1879110 [compost metagenome]